MAADKSPKQIKVERDKTHRLIPYRYSDRGRPILNLLAQDDDDLLSDLTELEGATNDRLLGESGRLPGASAIELVSGFRLAHIVNASFTHAHPFGGRFNSTGRGAWYAAFEMQTAQTEVAFHRAAELKEVGWKAQEVSPYIDCRADFRHEFHDIRGDPDFVDCLDRNSYTASQTLGLKLLHSGSAGIVYPSVRHKDVDELSVRGLLGEFQQDFAPWTGDALRIGRVFMHDPLKRIDQFFFRIHSARPS